MKTASLRMKGKNMRGEFSFFGGREALVGQAPRTPLWRHFSHETGSLPLQFENFSRYGLVRGLGLEKQLRGDGRE